MHDELGNRIKEQYENRTRVSLPRRTYTIIRIDGKAFHTLTKGFARPFDKGLMGMMDRTAAALCKEIQGAKFAYVQSDEISILLTDFETIHTDAWFDGNIQKIVSVSASIATAHFNKIFHEVANAAKENEEMHNPGWMNKFITGDFGQFKMATFDARTFTIPDPTEVANYFVWRQQDAVRNSIQMAARAVFSHKECNEKNCDQLQEMLFKEKGINWSEYGAGEKNGRIVTRKTFSSPIRSLKNPEAKSVSVARSKWVAEGAPVFTQDQDILKTRIPIMGQESK